MHTKRAPSTSVPSSNHRTSGTGTLPSACSACITRTWASNAVLGKTVWPVGSTRITSGWTSPSHVASKRRVSFENPDRPGMVRSPTATEVGARLAPQPVGQRGAGDDRVPLRRYGHACVPRCASNWNLFQF